MTSILIRDKKRRHRKKVHVKIETEIGAVWPQAKEANKLMGPAKARRGIEGLSFRVPSGSMSLLTLYFRLWPPELCKNKFQLF